MLLWKPHHYRLLVLQAAGAHSRHTQTVCHSVAPPKRTAKKPGKKDCYAEQRSVASLPMSPQVGED